MHVRSMNKQERTKVKTCLLHVWKQLASHLSIRTKIWIYMSCNEIGNLGYITKKKKVTAKERKTWTRNKRLLFWANNHSLITRCMSTYILRDKESWGLCHYRTGHLVNNVISESIGVKTTWCARGWPLIKLTERKKEKKGKRVLNWFCAK